MMGRLKLFRRRAPVVNVLHLNGVISDFGSLRTGVNLRRVSRQLEMAFGGKRSRAVALMINSPGGSPVQADLIQQRIRDLAQAKGKPVFAFCEDVAASGGYWIALGANEIHANPNSIIGSIGVISAGFGFEKTIQRLGIERRVHATGPLKGMLDPFRETDPQHIAHLRGIQDEIFREFCGLVRTRRGIKLKGAESDIFSGAFWTGRTALDLGLIDGLGDMRSVMRERYGSNVRFRVIGQRPGMLRRLRFGFSEGPASLVEPAWAELLDVLEARLHWQRFGL